MYGEETEPSIQELQGTQKTVPHLKELQEGNAKVRDSTVGFLLEGGGTKKAALPGALQLSGSLRKQR